jgi:hypothetical protein
MIGQTNARGHYLSQGVHEAGSSRGQEFTRTGVQEFRSSGGAGFPFVPEGHAIVARRFIAGLAINKVCVPEGRLKLDLGRYQSGVPDRFEVKNSTPLRIQASLRDAGHLVTDPGDKSPGYYRMSLRDEGKTGSS